MYSAERMTPISGTSAITMCNSAGKTGTVSARATDYERPFAMSKIEEAKVIDELDNDDDLEMFDAEVIRCSGFEAQPLQNVKYKFNELQSREKTATSVRGKLMDRNNTLKKVMDQKKARATKLRAEANNLGKEVKVQKAIYDQRRDRINKQGWGLKVLSEGICDLERLVKRKEFEEVVNNKYKDPVIRELVKDGDNYRILHSLCANKSIDVESAEKLFEDLKNRREDMGDTIKSEAENHAANTGKGECRQYSA